MAEVQKLYEDVATEDLPVNMQTMTITERHTYLKTMETQRKTIQTRIKAIGVDYEIDTHSTAHAQLRAAITSCTIA